MAGQIVHMLLVAAALVMGIRVALHLLVAHAIISRGDAWRVNGYWHAQLVMAALLIAAAVTW